jgi:hypothetical protein
MFQSHDNTIDIFTKVLQDQINNLTAQVANITQTQQRLQALITSQQQVSWLT